MRCYRYAFALMLRKKRFQHTDIALLYLAQALAVFDMIIKISPMFFNILKEIFAVPAARVSFLPSSVSGLVLSSCTE